jgi:hypothetical protein
MSTNRQTITEPALPNTERVSSPYVCPVRAPRYEPNIA